MKIKSFRELLVWSKAIDLVELVYLTTENFPKQEIYGLTQQIRRCVVSIPCNIAEGSQKQSKADFVRYLNIAKGSSAELETQLIIANRLKFCDDRKFTQLTASLDEISRMLSGLRSSLEPNKNKLTTNYSPLATKKG